jgi:hypothetical protein
VAVIVTAETLGKVKKTLDDVKSAGQADAVVSATTKLADEVSSEIHQYLFEAAWRTQARKDIENMRTSVLREAKALQGAAPTAPVGKAWENLRPAVSNLWFYVLGAQKWFPPDESTAGERLMGKIRFAGESLATAVADAPRVIVKSIAATTKFTAEVAGAVLKPAASLVGGTLGALLKPIWWVVAIAAVVGAGYLLVSSGKAGNLIPKGGS